MTPLFSIITVVYNDVTNITATIESVLSQTYENFEYIVIDGGSTDGTRETILPYSASLKHFISEKDFGIYYAMNKGVLLCDPSSLVIFINSGDQLYSKDTLKLVAGCFTSCHIYTGNTEIHYKDFSWVARSTKDNLSHQSTFIPASWLSKNPFLCKYSICADRENLEKAAKALIIQEVDIVIARFALGGISNYNTSFKKSVSHADELSEIQAAPFIASSVLKIKYLTRCLFAKAAGKDLYFRIMARIWQK